MIYPKPQDLITSLATVSTSTGGRLGTDRDRVRVDRLASPSLTISLDERPHPQVRLIDRDS